MRQILNKKLSVPIVVLIFTIQSAIILGLIVSARAEIDRFDSQAVAETTQVSSPAAFSLKDAHDKIYAFMPQTDKAQDALGQAELELSEGEQSLKSENSASANIHANNAVKILATANNLGNYDNSCPGFRHDKQMGDVCPVDGGYRVLLGGGGSVLTHGPDSKTALVAGSNLSSGASSAPSRHVYCESNTSNDYFQAIYARPNDVASSLQQYRQNFIKGTYAVNGFYNQEAGLFNQTMDLKFNCDSTGDMSIIDVSLPTSRANTTVGTIVTDLKNLGYKNSNIKYDVLFDGGSASLFSGYGTLWYDDRLTANNQNNLGGTYALVDGTGGYYDAYSVAHEVGHTLGAVQKTAPHTTGAGHCNDIYDVICYNDGGPTGTSTYACNNRQWFDCRHDDYFNLNPDSANYLYSHWNIGSSLNNWVTHSAVTTCTVNNPQVYAGNSTAYANSYYEKAGAPGTTQTFLLNIQNGDNCNSTTYSISPSGLASGWSESPVSNITLAPLATGAVSIKITSDPSASTGNYNISENVTNVSNSSDTAGAVLIYAVEPCANANPTVTVTPSSKTGNPGQALGYTVAIKNNDSGSCPSSSFNLTSSLPPSWTQSPSSISNQSIAPGGTYSTNINVTSPSSATAANYTVTETAVNANLASYSGNASGTYTIQTSDTAPPSVQITDPANNSVLPTKGSVTINVSASDTSGIASIKVYIDNVLQKTCTSATSCSYGWSMSKVSKGNHTIGATALDGSPNANSGSAQISVTK